VLDSSKPAITGLPNPSVNGAQTSAPPIQGSATGSDTCGNVAISHTDAFAPGPGNTGVITRTWKATDDSGNFATCDQTITVVDTTKPSITCSANTTVESTDDTTPAPQSCSDRVDTRGNVANTTTVESSGDTSPATQGSPPAFPTRRSSDLSHTDAFAPGAGNTGVITRTWKATDDCGNFATCDQTITVVDTTKPSITCSANTTVE